MDKFQPGDHIRRVTRLQISGLTLWVGRTVVVVQLMNEERWPLLIGVPTYGAEVVLRRVTDEGWEKVNG